MWDPRSCEIIFIIILHAEQIGEGRKAKLRPKTLPRTPSFWSRTIPSPPDEKGFGGRPLPMLSLLNIDRILEGEHGFAEVMGMSHLMVVPILHAKRMVAAKGEEGAEIQADIRFFHSLPLQEIMARLNLTLDSIAASN